MLTQSTHRSPRRKSSSSSSASPTAGGALLRHSYPYYHHHHHHHNISPPPSPMKTLFRNLIFRRLSRLLDALSKLKSAVSRAFEDTTDFLHYLRAAASSSELVEIGNGGFKWDGSKKKKKKTARKKVLLGSFRLHYNWCSSSSSSHPHSHVRPIDYFGSTKSLPVLPVREENISYYDSRYWNGSTTSATVDRNSSRSYRYSDYDDDEGNNYCHGTATPAASSSRRSSLHPPPQTEEYYFGVGSGGESQRLMSYLQWLEDKEASAAAVDPSSSSSDHYHHHHHHQQQQQRERGGEGGEPKTMMDEIDKLADLFIERCHEKFMLEKIESYRMYQEMLARSI